MVAALKEAYQRFGCLSNANEYVQGFFGSVAAISPQMLTVSDRLKKTDCEAPESWKGDRIRPPLRAVFLADYVVKPHV